MVIHHVLCPNKLRADGVRFWVRERFPETLARHPR